MLRRPMAAAARTRGESRRPSCREEVTGAWVRWVTHLALELSNFTSICDKYEEFYH